MQVIDFYTFGTINGQAVAIALEELGIKYQLKWVDLLQGEQKSKNFLQINPAGKIPVIVNHGDKLNDSPVVVTQTGAILIYLDEQFGQFKSLSLESKTSVLEWLFFKLTDISVNYFNNFYLKVLVTPKQREAAAFLKQRIIDSYHVFDKKLAESEFLTGENLTVADMASFPVVDAMVKKNELDSYSHLNRWHQMMSTRTAVIDGMNLTKS